MSTGLYNKSKIMSEENINEENSNEENSEENSQNNDNSFEENSNEESNNSEEKSEENSENKSEEKSDEQEPPVRKTKLDYIMERKAAKASKSNIEIHPDDEEVVSRIISEKFGDKFAQLEEQTLTTEIKEFVSSNEIFKGKENIIKKYAAHEAYKNLPIEQVAYAALGKELLKIGAEKANMADKEAINSSTGGGSSRGSDTGKKDYMSMTDEEMEIEIMKAKGQI